MSDLLLSGLLPPDPLHPHCVAAGRYGATNVVFGFDPAHDRVENTGFQNSLVSEAGAAGVPHTADPTQLPVCLMVQLPMLSFELGGFCSAA